MNKAEQISQIADQTGLTKAKAQEVYDQVFAQISNTLQQGEEVSIPGFGKFKVQMREARTGRNPQTGATIQIAASRQVKFSVAKNLKEAVNDK